MKLLILLFLLLTGFILTNSALSLNYASLGLELWFTKMIPALLPFMILSGIMVRMQLTEKLSMLLYPVIGPIYQVRKNVCYCMMMGFLCGFPMGAKVVAELYERQMLTKKEAEYLLAFCNNIGPVYFCSFVLPLLERKLVLPYLFGMYGIPLLYGLLLRYTLFRSLKTMPDAPLPSAALCCCGKEKKQKSTLERLLEETNASVFASVQSMLILGGYMILFNLLNLIPHIFLGHPFAVLAPLLEITGGLMQLKASLPLYSLLVLSFGGLSCIAQTYSCISGTDLSIYDYILHKVILTLLTGLFYLGWFLFAPASFLC
ncbi:MAG: hypothetical protein ACI4AB_08855 [Acetatifactor sp.]